MLIYGINKMTIIPANMRYMLAVNSKIYFVSCCLWWAHARSWAASLIKGNDNVFLDYSSSPAPTTYTT